MVLMSIKYALSSNWEQSNTAAFLSQSMLEIEVKSPCDDLAKVERMLKDRQVHLLDELKQVDTYYSHPCRDFGETDEALRLRVENGVPILHYKGPKLDRETKTREEIGMDIPDPAALKAVLDRLGFKEVTKVVKFRRTYLVGKVEVALDRVEGLGDFVELEFRGEDMEEGKRDIFALRDELGLKGNERRSYLELLHEKSGH
jgi:adenylate cyclase class 2